MGSTSQRAKYEGLGMHPYVVICPEHKHMVMSQEEYMAQMYKPNELWKCPICGQTAYWSDDDYEAWCDMNPVPKQSVIDADYGHS